MPPVAVLSAVAMLKVTPPAGAGALRLMVKVALLVPTLPSLIATSLIDRFGVSSSTIVPVALGRSEEHTSELQSRENLVCRLLLEKKKKKKIKLLTAKKKKKKKNIKKI